MLVLPALAFCQEAPKGTNTVIVTGVGFKQIAGALLDSGFIIDKSDEDLGYVKTEYKKLCAKCIPDLFLNIRIKDSVAIITGGWRSDADIFSLFQTSKQDYVLIPIRKEKSKVPRIIFAYVDKFAHAFNCPVSYAVR